MESSRRRKRSPREGSLVCQRLIKRFLEVRRSGFTWRKNRGDVVGHRVGHSNPEVQVQRIAKYMAEIASERGAVGDPANQFIDEESVGSCVVAVCFSRLPERFLPRKLSGDTFVIQHGDGKITEGGLAGLMGENVQQSGICFSILPIFRPEIYHFAIQLNSML